MFINYQYFQLLSFNASGGKKIQELKKRKKHFLSFFLELSSFFFSVKLVLQNSTEHNMKAESND